MLLTQINLNGTSFRFSTFERMTYRQSLSVAVLLEVDVTQNHKPTYLIMANDNRLTLRHRLASQRRNVDLVSNQDQVALSRKRLDP